MNIRAIKKSRIIFFSLVEMLIVVAIMFILVTMSVSVLSRTLPTARKVVCANQLRQIALCYKHYQNDYGMYPAPEFFLEDFRPIAPYMKSFNNQTFRCPSSQTMIPANMDEWLVSTDYLYSPANIADIEEHSLKNNGHGNNVYDFDPSNPSPCTQALINSKRKADIVYDARQPAHFKYINMVVIDDLHYEWQYGVSNLWTLDDKGRIERSLSPYPSYNTSSGSSSGSSSGNGNGNGKGKGK